MSHPAATMGYDEEVAMASLAEFNRSLEEHETEARACLGAVEDTAPTRVDEVLGVAVVHALLAQVAATKMVVTAVIELEEHLTQARTIGW